MSSERTGPSLLSWNPFNAWEPSAGEIEPDPGERASASIEGTLPAAVESADAEDPVLAPEGFTHWF